MAGIFRKLDDVESRFTSIEERLADPDLATKPNEFRRLSKERAELQEIVTEYRRYREISTELSSSKELLGESDSELVDLARMEISRLEKELVVSEQKLKLLLLPADPNDAKNVVLEVRAGAGGEEAALFVGDLFRLYQKFSESQGWKVELLSLNPTGLGGFKEIIALLTGNKVYSQLKWEAGVHRVQRVPVTETQGRIHTSTVTVAVLPEAEDVEVDINPADLKVDVYRSGGAGGQSVNTTDSAVRITHIPTGVVVCCQDERSQHKNREKGMKILRARLFEQERERTERELSDARRGMVGTGDRSERIRTYNFPQGRLTDHRIGLTMYQLSDVMEGKIGDILVQVRNHFQMEALKAQIEGN